MNSKIFIKNCKKKNSFPNCTERLINFPQRFRPYLETNTSEQVENTKAFEITIIKELGKLTP